MKGRLRVAVGILLVKDRIHQFYRRQAAEEALLNDFKRKHGYCIGRPFCMKPVADGVQTCVECRRAAASPQYKKKQSEYGRMRAQEREAERKERKPRKRAA